MTRVKSQGHVNLVFNIVTKDLRKLGYTTLANESHILHAHPSTDANNVALANLTQSLGMQSVPDITTATPRIYT